MLPDYIIEKYRNNAEEKNAYNYMDDRRMVLLSWMNSGVPTPNNL